MEWVNPHGWVLHRRRQPDGTVVNWAIEAGAPNGLLRRGLRKTDFPLASSSSSPAFKPRTAGRRRMAGASSCLTGATSSSARPAPARRKTAPTARSASHDASPRVLCSAPRRCSRRSSRSVPASNSAGQAIAVAGARRTASPICPGIWQAMNTASWDIQDHHARTGVPAGLGVVDRRRDSLPAVGGWQEKRELRASRHGRPGAKCYLPGVPRLTYMPFPFQIVQTPGQLTLLYEYVRAIAHDLHERHGPSRRGRSTGGWATRAAAGRATRWSSTSCTSTTRPGSTTPATSTATRST